VSSKKGKKKGSSLGYATNLNNSEVNLTNEKEKKPEPKKEESDDEDIFSKDHFEMIKSLRKVIQKRYKVVEVIGKGSYGCVSKAVCRETGRQVALKVMKN